MLSFTFALFIEISSPIHLTKNIDIFFATWQWNGQIKENMPNKIVHFSMCKQHA